jgi:hypothetical protein
MLTAEDLLAQEELIKLIPQMDDEALKATYRKARRDFERLAYAGREAAEPRMRCDILAQALADRAMLDGAKGAPRSGSQGS